MLNIIFLNNVFRKATITLIFLCLMAPLIDHRLGYICLAYFAFIGVVRCDLIDSKMSRSNPLIFYVPILIFISWLYGIFLGFLRGNEFNYIFTNFLGLAFYLAFYGLLASGVSQSNLIKCVFYAAMIYFIYGASLLLESLLYGGYFVDIALSVSDYRVLYLAPTLYLVPFISISMLRLSGSFRSNLDVYWHSLIPSWAIGNLSAIIFLSVFIFLSMSKGFIAVLLGLVVVYVFSAMHQCLLYLSLRSFIFLLYIIIVCALIFSSDFFDILLFSFSNYEGSNIVRDDQSSALVNEFTFIGAGLGAILKSGYIRSPDAPYGFELTFFNLVHKLGIMVIPLLMGYLIPLYYSLKNIFIKNGSLMKGGFIIGCMSFIIPGYANPLLLASNFIMLHCICLVLLVNSKK